MTEAALACVEATQSRQTVDAPLTQRGWHEYAQATDVARQAATYSREGGKVFIVLLKDPKQCSVNWPVSSPSGSEAVFATAEAELRSALSASFRRRFERLDPPPTFEAAETAAVRDLVNRYFSAFTAKDYDGIVWIDKETKGHKLAKSTAGK